MRPRRSRRRVAVVIVTCVIAVGLAGVWLSTRSATGACHEAIEERSPPWRMLWSEEHCISLVDPYVAEPRTQELATFPDLVGDREAVRMLQSRVRALDWEIRGVATVRFRLTDEGTVDNPRVVQGSGHKALDDAIAAIASAFEFSPARTASGPTEVYMEYIVGFQPNMRAQLLRWLSAVQN